MSFSLHPKLAEDTVTVGDLKLCRVLLMNNSAFPWLILVPMVEDARELFDLSEADYTTVMSEVRHTTRQFATLTAAHKMNVASLGNMVPQLHIHIVARFTHDAAWPQQVWNNKEKTECYPLEALTEMLVKTSQSLGIKQHYKNVI